MLAASLRADVSITGIPKSALELKKFDADLDKVSGKSATADLKTNLETGGFDEYAAKIDEAKAKSVRPITQDLKVKYDSTSANKAISDFERLKRVVGGGGNGKGLGTAIGEALTPLGGKWTAIVAASPIILDTAGALTAVAGSAGEAAAGVGALGIAAGGVASVGLAGLVSIAIPAISGLKGLYSAQTKYTEAVTLYGPRSKEAATALAKLHLAEQKTGPEATKLVKSLEAVKTKWGELTKSGQNEFLGIGADVLSRFEKLMPLLSGSANTSVAALRKGIDGFLEQVTGPGFNHFIETMTGTFARVVPEIGHGLGDWAQIFMRIAEDAAPSLEKVVHLWEDWSNEVLKSTGNSQKITGDIQNLVDQTMSWVHLLGAAGHLIIAVFSSGASEGQRLVDDLTGKLEQWTDWIKTHQAQVHEFFHRAAETLRDLTSILGNFIPQWVVFSEAMRPIANAILAVTKALNSIKIGNVSALTALLGAFVAARGIGKIGGAIADLSSLGGLTGGAATAEGAAAGAAGGTAARASLLSRLGLVGAEGGLTLLGAGAAGAGAFILAPGGLVSPNKLGENQSHEAELHLKGLDFNVKTGHNEEGFRHLEHSFEKTMEKLRSDAALGMGGIDKALETGLKQASETWAHNTPKWRENTTQAMRAAIHEIEQGMEAGTIKAKEGEKQINRLLGQIHLENGTDPFGLAKATVSTFKEVGSVTAAGTAEWVKKLEVMPKKAQEQAREATNGMLREWAAGHPKLERQIKNLTEYETRQFGQTNLALEKSTGKVMSHVAGSALSASESVGGALTTMGNNLVNALKALGSSNVPHFNIKASASATAREAELNHGAGLQRGGHISIGAPNGDSVPAMLERGEYVLNRNAVAAVGTHNLDALNYGSHARFQKGGQAGRLAEPHLIGAGAIGDAGRATIHDAHVAAERYLKAHTPKGGGVGYIPGGGGPVVAQMGRILLAAGYNKIGAAGVIGNALQESGWNPGAVGSGGGGLLGFTSGAISLASLQAFAKKSGKPWTDVGLQMQFFLDHEAGIRAGVNAQKNAAAAAAYFMENWEHPAVATENQARREEGARLAFAKGYQHGGLVDPRQHLTKAQRDAYLAWKWGKRFANGGLVEEADLESGISPSNSSHTTKGPSASDAVHWAMRHLGQSQPWQSQYPGEWCGDFLADDMRSIGLTPPSGYPEAAAWAGYGTNLGKGHMQAGAVIDYGHQHVALAISANEMVQGNDIHGVVGTSSIVSEVGGSPITAVRWPGYSTGPGAGSKPTETVPGVFHGAHTKALNPPSIPKTMHGIDREIHRWGAQLTIYEGAAKAAAGKPKTQQAIQQNVQRILKYLRELHHARYQLHNKIAKAHITKRLTTKLGKLTGREKDIEAAQRAYEIANQFASQVVALEPQEPILPASATEAEQIAAQRAYVGAYEQYVNGKERPAYEAILGKEATWRNSILGAEYAAIDLETNWEGRITRLAQNEEAIQQFAEQVQGEVKRWEQAHPKEQLPSWLKDREKKRDSLLRELPIFRFEEKELRSKLGEARGEFYPGIYGAVHPPQPPLAGTGSFEQNLIEVQGIHWPNQHEYLGAGALAPPRVVGKFGGAIWETQSAIEELGLSIQQAQANISASSGSESTGVATATNTEREQLLAELLSQSRQREALGEIERKTLGTARIRGYATGGLIAAKVGEQGPEIAAFPEGTRIHNAHETRQMLQPHVRVQVNHYGPEDTEVRVNDQIVPAEINRRERRGTRIARRGLARAGA